MLLVEPVVVSFMTVPTDLATWRKQARIDTTVEFQGEKILADFIQKVWPGIGSRFTAQWSRAETVIAQAIEAWTKIVVLVERHEKRQQLMAMDNDRFVETVTAFRRLDQGLYGTNDDLGTINDSLDVISESFSKTSQALVDESYVVNTVVLEKFKNYVDYLYSFQELCERVKRLRANTIPQLEQRIKDNEGKYRLLSTDSADAKSSELARLKTAIVNDKQELFQQMNREWLIKKRCLEEYVMFQETQYLVSEAWTEWTRGRVQFQHKLTTLYDGLGHEIVDAMPTARDGTQFTF